MLLLSGCAVFGGDMPIQVMGSVPASTFLEKSQPECKINLISSDTGKQLSYRKVHGEFLTSFVVEAKPKSYFFIVVCGDGRTFVSDKIMAGGRDSFNRIYEIGTLAERIKLE